MIYNTKCFVENFVQTPWIRSVYLDFDHKKIELRIIVKRLFFSLSSQHKMNFA